MEIWMKMILGENSRACRMEEPLDMYTNGLCSRAGRKGRFWGGGKGLVALHTILSCYCYYYYYYYYNNNYTHTDELLGLGRHGMA